MIQLTHPSDATLLIGGGGVAVVEIVPALGVRRPSGSHGGVRNG
jgi:hypothetical protein